MNNEPTAEATASAALGAQVLDATDQQKRLALGLISTCHTLNHLQYSITSVILSGGDERVGFRPLSTRSDLRGVEFCRAGTAGCLWIHHRNVPTDCYSGSRQCHRRHNCHAPVFCRQLSAALGSARGHRCRFQSPASAGFEYPVSLLPKGSRLGAHLPSLGGQSRIVYRACVGFIGSTLYGVANGFRRIRDFQSSNGIDPVSAARLYVCFRRSRRQKEHYSKPTLTRILSASRTAISCSHRLS